MAKQTPGSKCDAGSKYELSVTALFTSLLSKNKNVEDYRIFSNLDEAQPFDDVVVDVHFKGVERSHIYAIQIKSGKDKLNINKYYDGYNKIMGKQGLKFGESNRNNRIHFWYYCNKCPTKKTFTIATNDNTIDLKLRPRSRPYNLYESILDKTVSYELFSEDTNMIDDEQFLNRFYLFLNQPNTQKVINIVKGMWSIDNPGLILLYLDNYFAKSENGLDKATFEHEMLKLSLCDYVVTPTRAVALPHKAVHEWNRLTLQQDVTILCNETNIEQYLFGCILQNISDIITIDEWNRCVDSIGKIDRDVKIRLNVKLFKPETLKDLIIQIWIDGKAPLPLKVDTPLSLLKKFSHLKKSYIIIDSEVDKRYNEMKGYELRVFRDLGDVESDKIMKEIPVSLQGRKVVSLYEIIKGDRKLMQTVTCLHIINLIKPREVYLKRECLERNDYMFFIIETKNPQLCSNTEKRPSGANNAVYCELGGSYDYYNKIRANPRLKSYKIFRLRLIEDNKLTLVPPMENLSTAQYEEQHRGLECFFIDRNGENVYMENGDIIPTIGEVPIHVRWRYIPRHLRQCIKEDNKSLNESISDEFNTEHSGKLLTEKDFFKESSSKLTVITGDPGMGKTTLLHSLFRFCESEYYVLFINLACHQVERNEIIKVLLKNCEISKLYVAQFNNFTTLLHMCVRTGDIDVTKMVLQRVDAYLEHKRGHASTLSAIKACVAGYHSTTLETTKALLKKRDKRMYTPLELAIKFRNRDMVEMLLQYDADVNFRGRRHRSPLCAAVRKQNGKIVELLLQYGADPNYMKDGLISPLIVAVESEDTHIAQMLLHHNADVNYEDEYDGTPLCHAITTSRTTSIKLLLRNGANVNYVNRSGTTPLTYAIYLNCSKDIVQILLNYKADVNLKDRNDETPLSMAINTKNFLMIELLLQNGAYVDPMTLNIWISDICANKIDNKSTAQMLLRNLTDCFDAYGFSSLIIAVETGKTTIAKMLLKNNANVNFKTEYGFTALYVAAFKRNVDMVELLLEHGADVNIITSAEEILHNAKKAKKIEIVVRLLKNRTVYHFSSIFNDSSEPNSATNIIRTVSENWADLNLLKELRTAVKEGVVNLSTIAALKQWGGDIDIVDEFWTAVFSICEEMDDEMIDSVLLRNLGRNRRDRLVRSACSIPSDNRNLDLINILSRCLVSCTNFLRIAIELNDRELVQIALENPAAVKLTDSKNTPLCIAVRQQNVNIVKMLLEHNCPVNQVDGYGFLPLMIAIRTENLAIVEMLLANGADANYEAEGPGVSPLYIAALAENRPLVNILLKYGAKGKIRKSRLKKHGDSISTYQDMKEVKRIIEEESNKLRR